MYIETGNRQHPVAGAGFGSSLSWSGLAEDITPVVGTIATHGDDGWLLRSDDASEWEHQWYENGTLTLSHEPQPEPDPSELPPEPPSDMDAVMLILGEIVSQTGVSLDNLGESVRAMVSERTEEALRRVGEAQSKKEG